MASKRFETFDLTAAQLILIIWAHRILGKIGIPAFETHAEDSTPTFPNFWVTPQTGLGDEPVRRTHVAWVDQRGDLDHGQSRLGEVTFSLPNHLLRIQLGLSKNEEGNWEPEVACWIEDNSGYWGTVEKFDGEIRPTINRPNASRAA